MCYLVAKKADGIGSIAMKTEHGQALVAFKKHLYAQVISHDIQLVTISRPSAYGEYEPYTLVHEKDVFEEMVKNLSTVEKN